MKHVTIMRLFVACIELQRVDAKKVERARIEVINNCGHTMIIILCLAKADVTGKIIGRKARMSRKCWQLRQEQEAEARTVQIMAGFL